MKDMGQDLSGSMQGAGGIGGLLSATFSSTSTVFYAFDGNGNVMNLVDSSDGSIAATYEYSPFGICIQATGSMADVNRIRFSTKFWDAETGLGYWGYRYFNGDRWLSRDPLREKRSLNLYIYCHNIPLSFYDYLGREPSSGNVKDGKAQSRKGDASVWIDSHTVSPLEAQGGKFKNKDCVIYTFWFMDKSADSAIGHASSALVTSEGKFFQSGDAGGDAFRQVDGNVVDGYARVYGGQSRREWFACCCLDEVDKNLFKEAMRRVQSSPKWKGEGNVSLSCAGLASYYGAGVRGVPDFSVTTVDPKYFRTPGGQDLDPTLYGDGPRILHNVVKEKCDLLWHFAEDTVPVHIQQIWREEETKKLQEELSE